MIMKKKIITISENHKGKYLFNIKGEAETNDVEYIMSPNFFTRKKKKMHWNWN